MPGWGVPGDSSAIPAPVLAQAWARGRVREACASGDWEAVLRYSHLATCLAEDIWDLYP